MGRYTDQLFTNNVAADGATSAVVANRNANGTTVQAVITGTSGAVQANITLYGTHKNAASGGIAMATIVLGDGTLTSDVQEKSMAADYPFYYAVRNSISGTGATINLFIGH